MKKRIIAMCLCLAMVATLFVGCNQPDEPEDKEIVEIVCQLNFLSDFNEGVYRMEAALNEMLERDIGVHVTFERTDLLTSATDASLAITGGEQLDVVVSFGGLVQVLMASGVIMPLDELYDNYAPEMKDQLGATIDMCRINGQIYGVTVAAAGGDGFGYNMKKSYADKYGFTPDPDKLYTMDEMEAMFDIIAAGEGENTLMFIPWLNTYAPLNGNLGMYDVLNASDFSLGVLKLDGTDEDARTVVNLFETQEYAVFCQEMYDWAQKGYISADAAVTTENADDICKRSNVVGTFAYGEPDERLSQIVAWSDDVVVFNMVAPSITGGQAGIMWHISNTCEHPEKAMEFLNYFFKNPEAYMLLQYGFEGEEYEVVKTEGDLKQVRWLSDNPASLPYYNCYPVLGNMLKLPVFEPNPINMSEIQLEVMESITGNAVSPAVGYVFDSSSVENELAAIRAVIAQYAPSLNCGAVDPSTVLPEFISALKAAGIDKVIAENQKQLDAFLAAKAG